MISSDVSNTHVSLARTSHAKQQFHSVGSITRTTMQTLHHTNAVAINQMRRSFCQTMAIATMCHSRTKRKELKWKQTTTTAELTCSTTLSHAFFPRFSCTSSQVNGRNEKKNAKKNNKKYEITAPNFLSVCARTRIRICREAIFFTIRSARRHRHRCRYKYLNACFACDTLE